MDIALDQPIFDATRLAEVVDKGFCIIPGVLDAARCADVRARLVAASLESQRRGVPGWIDTLDPNDRNLRVFNLLDLDPVFIELIAHPLAMAAVHGVLGEHILISNFTANIALPGSMPTFPRMR